jgi:preprotein translocase subunit YajC
MYFKNLNNGDFVNVSSGIQVEIISIGTTVKGKVKGASITENCSVNGTFEVNFCQ